uniref:Uncharacterized protein n=1 Tax=Meloidogyne hapla TaxID=6305 RepID=A0A1I8C102_MELHA
MEDYLKSVINKFPNESPIKFEVNAKSVKDFYEFTGRNLDDAQLAILICTEQMSQNKKAFLNALDLNGPPKEIEKNSKDIYKIEGNEEIEVNGDTVKRFHEIASKKLDEAQLKYLVDEYYKENKEKFKQQKEFLKKHYKMEMENNKGEETIPSLESKAKANDVGSSSQSKGKRRKSKSVSKKSEPTAEVGKKDNEVDPAS